MSIYKLDWRNRWLEMKSKSFAIVWYEVKAHPLQTSKDDIHLRKIIPSLLDYKSSCSLKLDQRNQQLENNFGNRTVWTEPSLINIQYLLIVKELYCGYTYTNLITHQKHIGAWRGCCCHDHHTRLNLVPFDFHLFFALFKTSCVKWGSIQMRL